MTFWSTMLGPLWEEHVPADATEGRVIGEIVCPDCGNIMARLFDRATGVSLYSWNRGSSPSNPTSRTVGYARFTRIEAEKPADNETADLVCWRGHGYMRITGAECRQVISRYRQKGKKVRHPAEPVPQPTS